MGFWERATTLGAGDPIDVDFFELTLSVHANDIGDASIFGAVQLGLDAGELVELGELLALMPAGSADRAAWVRRVGAALRGARFFEALDSIEKVKAAVGIGP